MQDKVISKKNRPAGIVQAAVKLFSAQGFHNTAVQSIADAVGLNKATLYYHIHSKENILYLIQRTLIDDFLVKLEAICAEPGLTPTERLQQAIRAHLMYVTERQDEVRIYFRERGSISPELQQHVAKRSRHYRDMLIGIIDEGIKSGEFREVDAKLTIFFITGLCTWPYQWYDPGGSLTADQIATATVALIMTGLRKG